MRDSTKRLTRLAVLSALAVVFLLLANVLPAGRLVLLAVSSFPVCVVLIMYGKAWATGVYAVVSSLSCILFPGTAAFAFLGFFGYYPVMKSLFERLRSTSLMWALKYALYVAAFGLYWFLARTMFAADDVSLPGIALLIGGAAAFYVYDRCYTMLIQLYIEKIARYFP